MLIFNETIKAGNCGFDDVRSWCAATRHTPAFVPVIPAERRLRLRARQAHFTGIAWPPHRGRIGSQLREPLRDLIQADPVDRGTLLRLNGSELRGREKLRGTGYVCTHEF